MMQIIKASANLIPLNALIMLLSVLWVDNIIDPAKTREGIIEAIAPANLNADIWELKLGVFKV